MTAVVRRALAARSGSSNSEGGLLLWRPVVSSGLCESTSLRVRVRWAGAAGSSTVERPQHPYEEWERDVEFASLAHPKLGSGPRKSSLPRAREWKAGLCCRGPPTPGGRRYRSAFAGCLAW